MISYETAISWEGFNIALDIFTGHFRDHLSGQSLNWSKTPNLLSQSLGRCWQN